LLKQKAEVTFSKFYAARLSPKELEHPFSPIGEGGNLTWATATADGMAFNPD
jgi:hypothetical protein